MMNSKKQISKRRIRISAAFLTLVVLCIPGECFAGDASGNPQEKQQPITDNTIIESYCEYYGISESEDEEFINEVKAMLEERDNGYGMSSTPDMTLFSSSNSPLKKARKIPKSEVADIIWTNNPLTPFNHVGIYTSENKITEALSGGVKTRTVGGEQKEYPFNLYKVTTTANGSKRYSESARKKVAQWAYKQVGKKYDTGFANNKENTSVSNQKFNCSELVWKAWKFNGRVDLDSNGGKGVYPNNIKNSNRTRMIYQSK